MKTGDYITELIITNKITGESKTIRVKPTPENSYDAGGGIRTNFYRIGIIIPDRGDRPLFLENCMRMIRDQEYRTYAISTYVLKVDFKPSDNTKDITKRYRIGYDALRNKNYDIIFLIENDDWYSPTYIESMLTAWIAAGKPDLFGTRYTIYYHIRLLKGYTMHHETRSSAMSTMIRPDLNFAWCPDHESYTDSWLYDNLPYKLWTPPRDKPICIGIKHGVGMTGGVAHTDSLEAYTDYPNSSFDDADKDWLRSVMDDVSFEFYANYFANEQKI